MSSSIRRRTREAKFFSVVKKLVGKPISPSQLVMGASLLLALVPFLIYLNLLGGVPQISSAEALEILEKYGEKVVLLDVRIEAAYEERHIAGSISLPLMLILESKSTEDLGPYFQSKTLLVVCDVGVNSARATRHLNRLGISAYSVRGGIQDWGRAWPGAKDSLYIRIEQPGGVTQEPFRTMTVGEQAAAALAMLWIKPMYMLISGITSFVLLRRKDSELRILGWGLLVFLIGEVFCAINYALLKDNSYFAEYMHSYSMAVAFGLVAYALLEGLDARLFHFTRADKQCALLPVCGPCAKYKPVRCGVQRIALLIGISLIILSFIPLLSPYNFAAYNTQVGPVTHYYVRPFVHQWFEVRYSPVVAIFLIGAALLVMQLTSHLTLHPLARVFFCGGLGFLGFSLFRMTLGMVYAEALVWATFWEELTELMFISAVIYILWVFRHTLLTGFKPVKIYLGK